MSLPTGPDTLCFDKDEFMKVRGPRFSPGPGPGRGARPPLSSARSPGPRWRKPVCEMGLFGWKGLKALSSASGPRSLSVPGSRPRAMTEASGRVSCPREAQEFRPEQIAGPTCLPASGRKEKAPRPKAPGTRL